MDDETRAAVGALRRSSMALQIAVLCSGTAIAMTAGVVSVIAGEFRPPSGLWPPAAAIGLLPALYFAWLGYGGFHVWLTGTRPASAATVARLYRFVGGNIGRQA